MNRTTRPLTLCVACAILALTGPVRAAAPELDIRRDATVIAIEKLMPSVVNIATETLVEQHDYYESLLRDFYGVRPRQQTSISLGSGVIIDEDGYLLTNYHVVSRARRVQVKLWDGREYEADPLIATPMSDVALLRIKGKPGEKFKAIRFAKDDDLLLGETVLALGNPFGLGGSVTRGILSSKNRRPSTGNEPLNVEDWLQIDAAINPGNSGGPLANVKGELIGLNVAVYREKEGMGVGFAIPIKQVSTALSRFFTPELTSSLWLGALFQGGAGPLAVTEVQPGSPAARAGLRVGDQVLQFNGKTPLSLIDLNRQLISTEKGTFSLKRGEERASATVTLLKLDDLVRQRTGLTLVPVTGRTAENLGVKAGEGLYVEAVDTGSPAAEARLQSGFLVLGLEGQRTGDLRDFAGLLIDRKKGETLRLSVVVPRKVGGYVEFRQGVVELRLR